MANIKIKQPGGPSVAETLTKNFKASMRNSATASHYNNKDLADAMSMESADFAAMDASRRQALANDFGKLDNHIFGQDLLGSKDFLKSMGLESVDGIPAHSRHAANILAANAGNLSAYVAGQLKDRTKKDVPSFSMESIYTGVSSVSSIPAQGGFFTVNNGGKTMALESFEESELNKYLPFSIMFNVKASRQDPVNELFFDAISITPDQTGFTYELRIEKIRPGIEHLPNGDVIREIKHNLIDALIHPELLNASGTKVVPYVQDNKDNPLVHNVEHFVDAAFVKPYTVMVDNTPVLTAPLKMGMQHNLLALSSHPALIAAELMNQKDSLDVAAKLKAIYLKDKSGKAIKFDTLSLFSADFYKAPIGDYRDLAITFENRAFLAGEATKYIDGSDVAEFKALSDAGYRVRLEIRVSGKLNVEYGHIDLASQPIRVAAVTKDGALIPTDKRSLESDELKPLKALLEAVVPSTGEPVFTVEGYEIDVHRRNANLRTRGPLIDSVAHLEQITVPLRSPISIERPIVGGEKEYPDPSALAEAVFIMANNDGIATILNHANLLKRLLGNAGYSLDLDRDSLPGIGRHFFQPFYAEEELHLPAMINSVSSANRLKDLQGAITSSLNEVVCRMLQETNFHTVVSQYTGGKPGKVKAIIATDYRLAQYLNIQGDTRLFGDVIDFDVRATSNKLMRGKIVLSLKVEGTPNEPNPFGYGQYVWAPELAISLPMHRGSSTYLQDTVQPRYLHVVNSVACATFTVTGIEEVLNESTPLPVFTLTKEEVGTLGNAYEVPAPAAGVADTRTPPAGPSTTIATPGVAVGAGTAAKPAGGAKPATPSQP